MTTSSTPQDTAFQDSAARIETDLRAALLLAVQGPERLLDSLANPQLDLATAVSCDAAAIVVRQEAVSLSGDCEHRALKTLAKLHEGSATGVYHSPAQQADPGVLAVCFCPPEDGWLLWFRDTPPEGNGGWQDADIAAATTLRALLLEACLQRAAMTNRVQQRLIARLGHDLSNPLQSISMSAALLRPQSERDTELSRLIIGAAKKMDRLLAQVRDLNQLQSGNTVSINPVATDLSALVRSVLDDEQALYPELIIQAQVEPDIKAMVDAERYAEVIAHLLNNASQQSKSDTPTLVTLQTQAGWSRLTISSQIEPLSPEQLAELFQPVTRDAPLPDQNGLGMGLYVCAAIVQAHEGHVIAEQADGSITFSLTLPLLEQ